MKKVLTVKCEEGFCPLCGQELVYGTKKIMDYRGRASWECPKCKATGEEGFDAVFDGMHYNVRDIDGNEYELKNPEEKPRPISVGWLTMTQSAPYKVERPGKRPMLFRGQTRRKGQKVWMDGSPVNSNWVYGGLMQGNGTFSVMYTYDPIEKYPVYTDTLGQYSGIDDKNGTKIFEHDFLKVSFGSNGVRGTIFVMVAFLRGSFVWLSDHGEVYCHFDAWTGLPMTLEVIGNYHDNPELRIGCWKEIY